ncbi:MAG: hypothetical protein AAFP13_03955 [Pseudomonadota bacterium]
MTALREYARLETTGLWRANAEAQRREVAVSFGDATLVISDMTGRPLTHWSLAAVARLNAKEHPALFAPAAGEDSELLEIRDADMIEAIGKVQRAIQRARPKRGRLRWAILGVTTATLAWLGIFWLPGAVTEHTLRVLPEVTRAEIGARLLAETARIAGQPCADPFGSAALERLEARVAPDAQLHVLRDGLSGTVALPGGHILIGRSVLEDHDDPAVLAGYVVAETARAGFRDPLGALLAHTGALGAMQLLTTGTLSAENYESYAEAVLLAPPRSVPEEPLLRAFAARGLATTPFAYAVDITGETTLGLIEADPFAGQSLAPPLEDGDWLALQEICAR